MNTSTSHPTEEALRAYGLGRLDDAPAASVHSHLEGCPECRRRVAEITSDSFLGRLRDAQARPESFRPAISSTDGLSMLDKGPAPAAPPPASTLPPGLADLPNYEILRELGQGGMGTVFLARNTLMGRLEVLKVVSGHLVNRRGVLDRFLGEIRNAARLHHPNIVAAYTAHQLGESLVLAMEYVEGLDLSRLVKAKGPLPVAHACSYVHQAALGLQHAHEHGMVHRDIKPSNVMLAKQGNRGVVKVLDFGLAKVTSEGAVDGGLTHEGQMLGTPDYIAPEQISNARRADIRADIYSLGCTLYFLLTGKPPFRGDSLYDLLQAHHSMDATPLNLVRPEVPAEVAAIVAKMMAKEPGRRFQQPKEVAQALKPFFKAGNAAVQEQRAEVSRAGQAGPGRPVTGLVSTPTQPATLDEGPVVRPKTSAESSRPAVAWQSLIDVRETERPRDEMPAVTPMRRRPWFWPSVAVGVVLIGLFVAWGIVIRVKTADGTIELVELPKDAEVFVDGKEVDVTRRSGGKPAVITVEAGKRQVKVEKDGFKAYGEEVSIEAGGSERLTVRLIPLADSRPTQADANERTARSDDAKTPSAPVDRGGATPTPTSPSVQDANSNTHPTGAVDNKDGSTDPSRPGANASAPVQAIDARMALKGKAEIADGHWLVKGRELVQTDAANGRSGQIFFGDFDWTDYDFTVEVMKEEGNGGMALSFRRALLNGNTLLFGFGRTEGEDAESCGITAIVNGEERLFNDIERKFADHRWYRVHARVRGDHAVCMVYDERGREYVKLEAHDDRLPRGQVGLATESSSYRFRNIKVTDPDERILWEMPPSIGALPTPSGGEKKSPAQRTTSRPAEKLAGPAAVAAGPSGDLLPAGDSGRGAVWAYTTTDPGPKWADPDFDDSKWPRGRMGFGAGKIDVIAHTPWPTNAIWLRAEVNVRALGAGETLVLHQARQLFALDVFVNGQLLYQFRGDARYHDYPLGRSQRDLLHTGAGQNVIAIHAESDLFGGVGPSHGLDVGLNVLSGGRDKKGGDNPFIPLFDGKELTGWRCLPNRWRLEDGTLIGSPLAKDNRHAFLVSERRYRDFELSFKSRIAESRPGRGNSGVLFRSKLTDEKYLQVRGYQCEITVLGGGPTTGSVFMEPLREDMPDYHTPTQELVSKVLRTGDFNDFLIRCVGKHVTTEVNGFTMYDGDIPDMLDEGFIAWQLHSGIPPKEVVFKDVKIRILSPPESRKGRETGT